MAGTGGPLRLRDWLVAQIESGQYEGLLWEDAGKTLFRIPWKHAAKQGYQAQQDAALFRAWAVYKGKHSEGTDKDDPSTWKTRLRCALNKSMDFCEVRERSQLDTSNPYKVYRIVSHGGRSPVARLQVCPEEEGIPQEPLRELSEPACKINQECSRLATKDKSQFCMVAQQASLPPASLLPDPLADHRYPAQNPRKLWSPMLSEDFSSPGGSREDPCHDAERAKKGPGANTAELSRVPVPADCRLHVRLFYSAALVLETTVRSAQVCSLSPRADATATAAEHLLGAPASLAPICFPEPPPRARLLRRLLRHLERGVLLWAAPEGVFARRRCRGRVYWLGPLAPHRARPNKLERERTCQLLDTRCFFRELRAHFQDGGPKPEYQIRLCFGEEYPGPSDQPEERLIMAHVEPVFARQLLLNWKHSDVQQGP